MTREESINLAKYEETPYYFQSLINKIYDEFNLELQALENRSCESCSNFNPNIKSSKYAVCAKIGNMTVPHTFYCNRWESNK